MKNNQSFLATVFIVKPRFLGSMERLFQKIQHQIVYAKLRRKLMEILRAILMVLGIFVITVVIGFTTAKLFNYSTKKLIPLPLKKKGLPK